MPNTRKAGLWDSNYSCELLILAVAYAISVWTKGRTMDSSQSRHVRLFNNGGNQALRIPREFELPGSEAVMRKEGNRLIVEALRPASLKALLVGWGPLDEGMPAIPDKAPEPLAL